MKALVGALNQEKALVGAFSVIVQPVVEPMDRFAALVMTVMMMILTCMNSGVKSLAKWQLYSRTFRLCICPATRRNCCVAFSLQTGQPLTTFLKFQNIFVWLKNIFSSHLLHPFRWTCMSVARCSAGRISVFISSDIRTLLHITCNMTRGKWWIYLYS